jgi:transposase
MGATSYPERLKIDALCKRGLTDRQIAEQIGFSIFTVRKWRRKFEAEGKAGLLSHMGRPKRGALSSYPVGMRGQLKTWCKQHPGWGAKTLQTELSLSETFCSQRLPSRATLARWLKEQGEVRLYEKHSHLPATPACRPQACHEEWELDARSYSRVPHLGLITLIDLNDVFSRVKVLSYPCWVGQKRIQRYPSTQDYQLALRLAFTEWGLPNRLATDHDRIFYDETSKSPFPTRFHLWLLALGIELQFGRMGRPTDQGVTERSHQTWDSQVLEGAVFECYQSLWRTLELRKLFLNEHLPCASLQDTPPLKAHPEALTPRRPYRPEWEAELLDLNPVHAYLAKGQWLRKVSSLGAISIGRQIYHLGYHWRPDVYVELTFDPDACEFICRAPSGKETHLSAAWLTKQELMGELFQFQQIPFQFALPFTSDEWRALLYEQLPARGDTTL